MRMWLYRLATLCFNNCKIFQYQALTMPKNPLQRSIFQNAWVVE